MSSAHCALRALVRGRGSFSRPPLLLPEVCRRASHLLLSRPQLQEVQHLHTGSPPHRDLWLTSAVVWPSRRYHGSPALAGARRPPGDSLATANQALVAHDDLFERAARTAKSKAAFVQALDVFLQQDVRRRGHVEFIYVALRKMADFGVERDVDVYNRLLDVFPKDVFIPRNFIQTMFNHYPRQQECGVQVLEQMESHGVMPNVETKVLLVQIFGRKSHPVRKLQRLLFWFPRFKHANPFPVPQVLPEDPLELAGFSLTRVANDLDAKVTIYQSPSKDVSPGEDGVDLPHIVGIQSPAQMELLARHDLSRPVLVEGPFPLWLRKTCVHYYILRAEATPPELKMVEPYDPERCLDYPLQLDLDLDRSLDQQEDFNVDEVDEGPVYAMCMVGRGDQAVLGRWISGLQQTNPVLGRVTTLFRVDPGPRQLLDGESEPAGPQPDQEEQEEELRRQGGGGQGQG